MRKQFQDRFVSSQLLKIHESATRMNDIMAQLGVPNGYTDIRYPTIYRHEKMVAVRNEARDARRWQPYAIRATTALTAYTLGGRELTKRLSKNDDFDEYIKQIIKLSIGDSLSLERILEDVFSEGYSVFTITQNDRGDALVGRLNPDTINIDLAIKHPLSDSEYIAYEVASPRAEKGYRRFVMDARYAIEPAQFKSYLSSKHDELETRKIEIETAQAIILVEHNKGVPMVSPAIPYMLAISEMGALQSAVLSSIAAIATYARIDDPVEREEALELLENTDREAGSTVVTSGTVSALNLNISMLDLNSAFYDSLIKNIINSFAGLDRTDLSEKNTGSGLASGEKNNLAILSGKTLQRNIEKTFTQVIEACLSLRYTNALALGNADLFIDGVDVEVVATQYAGLVISSYCISYENNRGVVIPFISQSDFDIEDKTQAIIRAITLGGVLHVPLGTPAEFRDYMEDLGYPISIDDDATWEELYLESVAIRTEGQVGQQQEGIIQDFRTIAPGGGPEV